MEQNIKIISQWTHELTAEFREQFIGIVNTVFGNVLTDEKFEWTFMQNVYDPSLLTIVFANGKAAAVDAMWRNDLQRPNPNAGGI